MTLLEVLVALCIISGSLAIAVPYMQRPSGITLDDAARKLALGLRTARSTAIRTNSPVAFVVDTESRRFGHDSLTTLAGDDPPIAMSLVTTSESRLGAAAGTIRFFPDGGSTGGGVELVQRSRSLEVRVDWLTGRVSVSREAVR